ncbi:GNAT family N-acetyltransferase [Limosilactobacillus sp. STM2_1]|uniref:GNAT family N-acetyltransferase n=1 Tax=Limosilactobacillus rudii TaxID=2759755 RepID=A0A7W3UNK3_9LACO|nr:GNAT family N-acetyltransferase [Limosilactobacillus rudii]MBB1080324.1 GNAT family N-acetyltransferase [Limosilactobacillus rudii]MBB1098350.1 GNAT family N-acetyltransferase [Limosilactobacillus rudii]MCD7135358.1 GNAT family N-acetyltransferase [Limosilactobacillus rudii]
MADEISIKLATSADAGQVLQFLRTVSTESNAVLIPHLREVSKAKEAQNIDLINQFDDCVMMLAMLEEEIVGMVTVMVLEEQPTTGELGVVVRKKYWRNGIGRLLVDEAEYWFETYSSLENLVLTVFDDNIAAINLYHQLGFVDTGTVTEEGRRVIQMKYQQKNK